MPTQVEALARYAVRASFTDLSPNRAGSYPSTFWTHWLCSIAALGAGPVEACRAQVAEFGGGYRPQQLIGWRTSKPLSTQRSGTPHSCATSISGTHFPCTNETCPHGGHFGVALTIADYVGRVADVI